MRKYIKWILQYWKRHKLHIAVLCLFTVLSSLVVLSLPLVFRYLLDDLDGMLEGAERAGALERAIMILAALAVAKFIAGLYPGARAWLNSKIGLDVRDTVFDNIRHKGYRFWNRFRPGDLTTRLTDDIVDYPRIGWFSCSGIFRALESTSRLVFCLVVMIWMSWQLTLLAIIPLPVMLYIFYRIEHRLGKKVEQSRRATSHTNDLLDSTFAGISIVKAYGAEEGQRRRLRRLLDSRFEIDLDLTKLLMKVHSVYHLIGQIGKVTVVLAGGLLVIRNRIGLGDFYAFYLYLDLLLAPMMDIPNLFVTSRQAFTSIDREQEIMNFPAPPPRKGTVDTGRIRSIEFRGAGFSYDCGGGVSGLSARIDAPSIVAVVGAVGSGKSSLLKIIAGLLPCSEGEILINGVPMAQVSEEALIRETGYVPQESVLFSETVAENVSLGRGITEERIAAALETAGLPGTELSRGAGTILGQGGTGVSGGQKQRVAIARALAGAPSLFLFDDCTASLDAEKEEALWTRMSDISEVSLTFVVTHREATAAHSDLVLLLDGGRLVTSGSHHDLLSRCELYRDVLAAGEEAV